MPLSNEINDPAVLEKVIPKKVSHHIPWLPCVEPARFGDPMKAALCYLYSPQTLAPSITLRYLSFRRRRYGFLYAHRSKILDRHRGTDLRMILAISQGVLSQVSQQPVLRPQRNVRRRLAAGLISLQPFPECWGIIAGIGLIHSASVLFPSF